MRAVIVIPSIVPGCCHKQNVSISGSLNGGLKRTTKRATTPTIVEGFNVNAIFFQCHHVINTGNGPFRRTKAICSKEFTANDRDIVVHPNNADTVIPLCTNSTRNMSTMALIIVGVGVAVYGINTVNIINVTVTVVINAITRDFAGVHPHIVNQIRVVILHTGVDHTHDYVAATG